MPGPYCPYAITTLAGLRDLRGFLQESPAVSIQGAPREKGALQFPVFLTKILKDSGRRLYQFTGYEIFCISNIPLLNKWLGPFRPFFLIRGFWANVTFDDAANTMRLYKNGVLVSSNTNVTGSFTLEPLYRGSHNSGGIFQGRIDAVRIWSLTRTEAEIRANMYHTFDGDEDALEACCRFDQQPNASHTTAYDLTANTNRSTLTYMTPATEEVGSFAWSSFPQVFTFSASTTVRVGRRVYLL
jgi:hypothetical protein